MPLKATCTRLTSTSIRGNKTDVSILLEPLFYVLSTDGSSYQENHWKNMGRGNGANEPSSPAVPRPNRSLSRMLENFYLSTERTLGLTRRVTPQRHWHVKLQQNYIFLCCYIIFIIMEDSFPHFSVFSCCQDAKRLQNGGSHFVLFMGERGANGGLQTKRLTKERFSGALHHLTPCSSGDTLIPSAPW